MSVQLTHAAAGLRFPVYARAVTCSLAQRPRHHAMRNACLIEYIAGRFESFPSVKRHCRDLCIDDHGGVAAIACDADEGVHQRATNPSVPPGSNDSDAADVTVEEQPRTADRLALRFGKRMDGNEVRVVPFEHLGHALLDNEDIVANAAQRGGR